jgi:hypothetical protein
MMPDESGVPWTAREEKMLKGLIGGTIAMLAITRPLAAQAADAAYCATYADAAINQVRAALANPACAKAAHGPRWTTNRDLHFAWCRTQPIAEVEAEHGARTGFLHACTGT